MSLMQYLLLGVGATAGLLLITAVVIVLVKCTSVCRRCGCGKGGSVDKVKGHGE